MIEINKQKKKSRPFPLNSKQNHELFISNYILKNVISRLNKLIWLCPHHGKLDQRKIEMKTMAIIRSYIKSIIKVNAWSYKEMYFLLSPKRRHNNLQVFDPSYGQDHILFFLFISISPQSFVASFINSFSFILPLSLVNHWFQIVFC